MKSNSFRNSYCKRIRKVLQRVTVLLALLQSLDKYINLYTVRYYKYLPLKLNICDTSSITLITPFYEEFIYLFINNKTIYKIFKAYLINSKMISIASKSVGFIGGRSLNYFRQIQEKK